MDTRRALRNGLGGAGISIAIIAFIAVVAIGTVAFAASGYFKTETTTTTVLDKERVCDSDGNNGVSCEYLIYTEAGTFRLSDSVFAGRWSSSDAYGRVKRCHRYEINSYGWRLPLFSTYPNIKEMDDLGRDEGCEP